MKVKKVNLFLNKMLKILDIGEILSIYKNDVILYYLAIINFQYVFQKLIYLDILSSKILLIG